MPRPSSASLAYPVITSPQTRLKPPIGLTDAERQLFVEIVADYPAAQFRPSDVLLLISLVRATLAEHESALRLACDGYVTADNKPSPWVAVWGTASKTMLSLSRALRTSPLSRGPNPGRPSAPPQPMSYYDRQRLLEGDDDAS